MSIFDSSVKCPNILIFNRKYFVGNLHTEGLVSLLESTHGEIFQRVHVVTKVQPAFLSNSQGAGRDEGVSGNLCECGVSSRGIHQQFSVQGKNWKEKVSVRLLRLDCDCAV